MKVPGCDDDTIAGRCAFLTSRPTTTPARASLQPLGAAVRRGPVHEARRPRGGSRRRCRCRCPIVKDNTYITSYHSKPRPVRLPRGSLRGVDDAHFDSLAGDECALQAARSPTRPSTRDQAAGSTPLLDIPGAGHAADQRRLAGGGRGGACRPPPRSPPPSTSRSIPSAVNAGSSRSPRTVGRQRGGGCSGDLRLRDTGKATLTPQARSALGRDLHGHVKSGTAGVAEPSGQYGLAADKTWCSRPRQYHAPHRGRRRSAATPTTTSRSRWG